MIRVSMRKARAFLFCRRNRLTAAVAICLTALLLLAVAEVVHVTLSDTSARAQSSKPKSAGKGAMAPMPSPRTIDADRLPQPVADMRDAILTAARSGQIGELKVALDLNEMKPELAETVVADPIAFWKRISSDGEGREILAVVWTLLESSIAILPLGKDVENNAIYVWPSLSEKPLDALTPREEIDLLRLVPAAEAAAMKAKRRYTGWRLAIGADGTWHSLKKIP